MEMKELTRAEKQIMQVLWEIEKGFVKDIVEQLPDPKPAYNTVSTIVRILETKGFVAHKAYGKTHEYFPQVSKEEYMRFMMNDMVDSYFGGSFSKLVSHFVKDKNIGLHELDEILKTIEKGNGKKKKQ
ncbi:MAG: putative transcriptional regulator [Bacteroidetes bacterium]|nr:MAG: putative transcriptional regulator [Bacteroidota bacterium]